VGNGVRLIGRHWGEVHTIASSGLKIYFSGLFVIIPSMPFTCGMDLSAAEPGGFAELGVGNK